MEIVDIFGATFPPPVPIEVKFCPAMFDVSRCNKSLLRGEKPDFWHVSKFNTGNLVLRDILPVIIRTTSTLLTTTANLQPIYSLQVDYDYDDRSRSRLVD